MKKNLSIFALSTAIVACTSPSNTVHHIDDVSFEELNQLLTYEYSSKDSFHYVEPQLNLAVAKRDSAKFEREYRALYNRLIGSECDTVQQEINSAYKEHSKHAQDMDLMDGMVKLTMTMSLLAVNNDLVMYQDGSMNSGSMHLIDTYGIKGMYNELVPVVETFYTAFGIEKPDYKAYQTTKERLAKAQRKQAGCQARMQKNAKTLLNKIQSQATICESHQWFKNYQGTQLQQLCATAVTEDFISRLNHF